MLLPAIAVAVALTVGPGRRRGNGTRCRVRKPSSQQHDAQSCYAPTPLTISRLLVIFRGELIANGPMRGCGFRRHERRMPSGSRSRSPRR